MMDWVADRFHLLTIRAVRMYGMHPLTQLGIGRVNRAVNRAAQSLRGQYHFTLRARDGRKFLIDPKERQYHLGLLGLGIFEPLSTRTVSLCVEAGDVALDIGANFGWYTTLLSRRVGRSGAVHAFEPLPSTFEALQKNCRLNGCANVTLNNLGLSSAKGKATIHYFPGEPHGNATLFNDSRRPSVAVDCELTTLDSYMDERGLERCAFVKCDAEGAERIILQGARRFLARFKPAILIELHGPTAKAAGYEATEPMMEIHRLGGYRFFALDEKKGYGEIPDPLAYRFEGYVNVLCVQEGSRILERVRVG